MERKIVFRAKCKDTGEWVYGSFLQDDYGSCCIVEFVDHHEQWHDVNPETIGQFTGLHDKDGTDIYEGDIVQYSDTMGYSFISPVLFKKGCFCMETESSRYIRFSNKGIYKDWECTINYNITFEVIGNIHDNPELLNQQTKQNKENDNS